MSFGPEVKNVYVSLVAVGAGRAWFDDVALANDQADVVRNGGAESGCCITQRRFTLFVLQSPVAAAAPGEARLERRPGRKCASAGCPSWAREGATVGDPRRGGRRAWRPATRQATSCPGVLRIPASFISVCAAWTAA